MELLSLLKELSGKSIKIGDYKLSLLVPVLLVGGVIATILIRRSLAQKSESTASVGGGILSATGTASIGQDQLTNLSAQLTSQVAVASAQFKTDIGELDTRTKASIQELSATYGQRFGAVETGLQAAQTAIGTLQQATSGLASIASRLGLSENAIETLKNATAALTGRVTSAESRLTGLDTRVNAATSGLQQLQSSTESSVADLRSQIAGALSTAGQAKSSILSIEHALQMRINQTDQDIRALNDSSAVLSTEFGKVKTSLADAQSQAARATTNVSALTSSFESFKLTFSKIQNAIDDFLKRITGIEQKNTEQDTSIKAASDKATTANNGYVGLSLAVQNTQADIAAIKKKLGIP